jgi:hypothetical protein
MNFRLLVIFIRLYGILLSISRYFSSIISFVEKRSIIKKIVRKGIFLAWGKNIMAKKMQISPQNINFYHLFFNFTNKTSSANHNFRDMR